MTHDRDAEIIELYAAGLGLMKVGVAVGRSMTYARNRLIANGVTIRPCGKAEGGPGPKRQGHWDWPKDADEYEARKAKVRAERTQ